MVAKGLTQGCLLTLTRVPLYDWGGRKVWFLYCTVAKSRIRVHWLLLLFSTTRPTFQVYARYTCKLPVSKPSCLSRLQSLLLRTAGLGALGCLVLMFYINATYAGATIGKEMGGRGGEGREGKGREGVGDKRSLLDRTNLQSLPLQATFGVYLAAEAEHT